MNRFSVALAVMGLFVLQVVMNLVAAAAAGVVLGWIGMLILGALGVSVAFWQAFLVAFGVSLGLLYVRSVVKG